MGKISDQVQGPDSREPVRCPFCAAPVASMKHCRHVRWTFDQGGPLDFAYFALETSPYVEARGHSARDIPKPWWDSRTEWIAERVFTHFDAREGYVFGELAQLDMLARDIWREFAPEPARPAIIRY